MELEDNPTDFTAITRLGQHVWSLQYQDANDRTFAMFLTLWCNDVMQNFGNSTHNCMNDDHAQFGPEIGATLKEIFLLDYGLQAVGTAKAAQVVYFHAMQLLTTVYVEAIVRSNARAACCL